MHRSRSNNPDLRFQNEAKVQRMRPFSVGGMFQYAVVIGLMPGLYEKQKFLVLDVSTWETFT